MSIVRSLLLATFAMSQLVALSAFAAQHPLPTKVLFADWSVFSNLPKLRWKAKESGSVATVTGDPTADGATLRIQITVEDEGADQCITLPPSGWTAIGTLGFVYRDPTLANGPVKVALVKKTPSGTVTVKAILPRSAALSVYPGFPTPAFATNLTLGTGDEYCGGSTDTPAYVDSNTNKWRNVPAPASCISSCNATTTSTTLP